MVRLGREAEETNPIPYPFPLKGEGDNSSTNVASRCITLPIKLPARMRPPLDFVAIFALRQKYKFKLPFIHLHIHTSL